MPSDSAWHNRRNKPQLKLNIREIEWVSLMNGCLMGTDTFQKCENDSEKYMDPKLVMDVRHQMVKESAKTLGVAPGESHTEALKLLRINNRNRMLKQKEEKMVEKEIERLKQSLENNRSLIRKKLDEAPKIRTKSSPSISKFVGCYAKMWKRLEFHDGAYEVDTWLGHSVQMSMETKINRQGIPFDVKVSVKRQSSREESCEPVGELDRNTITDEPECIKQLLEADEGKNEIMRRFLERNTKSVDQELLNDYNERDEIMEKISEIKNKRNRRAVKLAWATWKDYARRLKNRKREKTKYEGKIEAFLSRLREKEFREAKGHTNGKNEIRIGTAKNSEKQTANEEKDKRLKKLMAEVKTSRKEVCQKLREINKGDLKNEENYSNLNFLKRMEKRREERLKRWKEIQDKKLKLEEEKKKAQELKEIEEKQKEEENKRKKLEELKEKRRLDKEKQKEKERERERLRHNTNLAENHYRKYLLRSYGLRPWLALMKTRDSQLVKASEFFEGRLTLKAFHRLTSNVREEINLKAARALEFHGRLLKKNFLLIWLEFHKEKMKQNQVAADWNEFRITDRVFKKWMQFTQNEQLEYLNKKNIARLNYERNLKMKYLKKLRDYPDLKKLEQAKENRKQKWRQRVKEILPDYQPVEVSKDFYSLFV